MLRILITVCLAMIIAGAGSVSAQDTAADPLAFTPTGDALWDTYAAAQLEMLGAADAFTDGAGPALPALSECTLAAWEPLFGDDPRYWQLCYWEAGRYTLAQEDNRPEPRCYLECGVSCGVVDPITEMLLYQLRREELDDNWQMYAAGTLPPDSDFAPVITDGAAEYSWYVRERLALADALVAACPDESWAFYERAMSRFQYGTWEDGLADLALGNQASNNRMPLPFPMSFVNQRVTAGEDCGSPVVVGLTIQTERMLRLPNFIRLKDQMKNQQVRLLLGSPLNEVAPWHGYTCRLGMMEGSEPIQWLVAHVMRNMILHHLFVETPEVFSVDQRQALWGLYGRGFKIREYASAANDSDLSEMTAAFERIQASYGIDLSSIEEADEEFWQSATVQAMILELAAAGYQWQFEDYQRAMMEYYPEVKERFEMLATFDMESYSWPE